MPTCAWARLLAKTCRILASLCGWFTMFPRVWTLGCRVGVGEEDRGEEVGFKEFVNAWSPRHLFLQDHETAVVVSRTESDMTRRSINQRSWAEGWVVQRILYATDRQTGDRKVDRWNGCCSTQPHSVLGCGKVMVAHFAIF